MKLCFSILRGLNALFRLKRFNILFQMGFLRSLPIRYAFHKMEHGPAVFVYVNTLARGRVHLDVSHSVDNHAN